MKVYSFETLNVWQRARKLTVKLYKITDSFPKNENFGLINQMRRATVSVQSNLAEGSARRSFKDKAHFTTIAYSSLMELLNQFILSNDLGYLDQSKYEEIRSEIDIIAGMISNLRKSQLAH
ncbi:MAG: four helix bundle protein [Bacteroidota bacterium]